MVQIIAFVVCILIVIRFIKKDDKKEPYRITRKEWEEKYKINVNYEKDKLTLQEWESLSAKEPLKLTPEEWAEQIQEPKFTFEEYKNLEYISTDDSDDVF